MDRKPIYILFKTHLDIGFTDYSENVIHNYLTHFIPNAISVGYALRNTDTPFIWSVGSWILNKALQKDKGGTVDRAIRDGILTWHGLPFTTHTEFMNSSLFQLGLSLSKKLDERYGRTTLGAKMTDVPGHTKGLVRLMADSGLTFLHVGVNPVAAIPPVPSLFRWRCDGREITVMYQGDYGDIAEFDDFAVCFAHTGDNLGPQSKEDIIAVYNRLRARYPNSPLLPGTLNDLARLVCSIPDLPVLDCEIGDTWIHGVGTDPEKVSRYRRLLRYLEANNLAENTSLSDNLLLVPEHTWGLDIKTHFPDDRHYFHWEMDKILSERARVERSWDEQRNYVASAEKCLGLVPEYPTEKPDLTEYLPIALSKPDIQLCWEIFTNQDYLRYQTDYLRLTDENRNWALWDNVKIGLPDDPGGLFEATVVAAYEKNGEKLYKMTFPTEATQKYGLPYFWVSFCGNTISLKWFHKKASRFPQACWFKFTGLNENWELDKLGQWISPESIVGSPLISSIDSGVRNMNVRIHSLDAALVAPYGRRLLRYGEPCGPQDLWFNLYNNIWNTNFPMWYDGDAVFRFICEER